MRAAWRRLLPIGLAACMLAAVLPSAALAERTVGISVSTFDFSLGAGQMGSGELYVLNNGDEDINVLIYAADQIVGDDGSITYEVPDRSDLGVNQSPASWVSTKIGAETKTIGNIPYVFMRPGEQIPVRFEVTVPPNGAPGDHEIILFFEMTGDPNGAPGEATTSVTGRVGARVNMRVAGDIVERIEVQPFVARTLMLGKLNPFTFVVRNTGNVDKEIDARLVVLNGSLEEVYASDVATDTAVYASSNHEFSGTLKADRQLFGRYTLRVEISYPREGGDSGIPAVTSVDKTIWVFPLWLAIAIVLVVGLGALWWSWRQSQIKARKRAAARREERRRHLEESTAARGEQP